MGFISSKSKDGLNEVVFNDTPNARQRYKLNGKAVPGVTTAIKAGFPTSEGLVNWKVMKGAEFVAEQMALEERPSVEEIIKLSRTAWKKEAEEAAGIGVAVHQYAELVSLGKKEEALESLAEHQESQQWNELVNAIYKVDDFFAQNKDEILFTEAIVGSVKHQFAGRFDRLVKRDGLIIMSDFKTSKNFYVDQFIQDALYAVAVKEWLDIEVTAFEVIRFGKEGGDFKQLLITEPEEIGELKRQALRCLDTYNFNKFYGKDKRFK